MFENIPQSIVGFVITGLFIWLFMPVAARWGLVDKPGGHKTHQGAVPVVGGIAMFIGILSSVLLLNLPWVQVESVIFAALLVLIVGTLDDKYFLSPYVRFIAQTGAAMIIVIGDNTLLLNLGHLMSESTAHLGSWAIPLTIFAVVGVINAVNMSDGLDGLAGGLSIVTLSGIAVLLALSGTSGAYSIIPLVFIAVLSGFLLFNLRTPWLGKAKIFMGNGGSMLLGVLLAWLLIKFSQGETRSFDPVIALWVFAIPLMDTVAIMLRRLLKGKSPFSPDQEHIHHLFLSRGFSVGQSVVWVISIASAMALAGILGAYYKVPEPTLFFAFISIFIVYFWYMERSWNSIAAQKANKVLITGGTDNSVITPLKRERYKD